MLTRSLLNADDLFPAVLLRQDAVDAQEGAVFLAKRFNLLAWVYWTHLFFSDDGCG